MSEWLSNLLDLGAIRAEKARRSLLAFIRHTMPDYQVGWHHRLLCEHLDRMLRGDLRRLIVSMPPRAGKTEIVSRRFPAYVLGKNPDARVIACSYSADLASRNNRDVQRIMDGAAYQQLFPGTKLPGSPGTKKKTGYVRTSDLFEIVDHVGSYRSAGVGGGITGMGGNCFPGETRVLTATGWKPIAEVASHPSAHLVLSYNHSSHKMEWRQVLASRSKWATRLVTLTTRSGRCLRTTPEHRLFDVQRGYREAGSFGPGDCLASLTPQSGVPALPATQGGSRHGMSDVLPHHPPQSRGSGLLVVRETVPQAPLRDGEARAARDAGPLLLRGMLPPAPCGQEPQEVRAVRQSRREAEPAVLQALPHGGSLADDALLSAQAVHGVRDSLPPWRHTTSLLLPPVCQQGPQQADAGCGQLALQDRHQLREGVQGCQAHDTGTGSGLLCGLQAAKPATPRPPHDQAGRGGPDAVHPVDPPHQRGRGQQHPGEPRHALLGMPQTASPCGGSWQADPVSVAECVCGPGESVYDLQVEGNANFFAEGVLVHNCLILDDPFKNREEADSPTVREAVWEWYTSTLYTRQEPGACILVCMTRWNRDDIVGRLLARAEEDSRADQWSVLTFPAIAEEVVEPLDPRQPGEPLWPERFPLDELEKMKASMGAYEWSALYQQNPRPEGGTEWPDSYFPPSIWFTDWPSDLTMRGIGLDPSKGKDAKWGDYSALVKMGRDSQGILYVEADLGRWNTDEITARAVEMCREFRPDVFAIEANQFQELLATQIARAGRQSGMPLPVVPMVNTVKKEVRIRRLTPYLAQGVMRFKGGSPGTRLLVQQLKDFPLGDHDDGADGAELVLRALIDLDNGRRGKRGPTRIKS